MNRPNRTNSDYAEIKRAIAVLFPGDTVVELRVLKANDGKFCNTVSGYFDEMHREELLDAADYWSGNAPSVYVTLKPVNPDYQARAFNRVESWAKNTTGDTEILHRVWLLNDFDPKRPSGVSATDQEHEAAIERAHKCRQWLAEQGLPQPILADSSNGAHLLNRPSERGSVSEVASISSTRDRVEKMSDDVIELA